MLNLSSFPQKVDEFVELFDLPPSMTTKAKRSQELRMKPILNATEQTELNALTTELASYLITPYTWNKFASALQNVQSFFKERVDGYIDGKQEEWAGYVKDFRRIGVYSDTVNYKFQNMVTYKGDLYICLVDCIGVTPVEGDTWGRISSKGDKGDVGLNLYYKGDYVPTTTYAMGDAVTFDKVLYYCKADGTVGFPPSDATKWFLYDRVYTGKTAPSASQEGLIWIELQE